MHANTHGAIGIAIISATYVLTKSEKKTFLIGGALAFASHYVLDFIGEAGYKSVQEMLFVEFGVYLFALVLMSFLGRRFFVFTVFANLMDYIDKKMYLALFFPKEYEITYFFHSKNQVLLPISYNQTIAAAFISVVIIVVCFVLLKWNKKALN